MRELCLPPYDVTDFVQTVAPVDTPISLPNAKTYLRVDGTEEDNVIFSLITAATGAAQNLTWLQFVNATYKSNLTHMARHIKLWKNPVVSITSIKYYDKDNAQQTLATTDYTWSTLNGVATIIVKSDIQTYERMDAVEIIFVSGFGSSIPPEAISAIWLILGHLYEHREDVVMGNAVTLPMGSEVLLKGIQIKSIA